jgi:hypothetical protein
VDIEGLWTPFTEGKERLDPYNYLDAFDKMQDAKSVKKQFSVLALDELVDADGNEVDEQFNFGCDPGVEHPAEERFMRLFTLPINTAKGLVDWHKNKLMQVGITDLRLVPNIGALIGYEHFSSLPADLQRFMTLNLSYLYPILGRWDEIERAFRSWLGPNFDFDPIPFRDNVAYVGDAEFAVVTPTPEETGTEDDHGYYITSLDPASTQHFKGLDVFVNANPFLATSMPTAYPAVMNQGFLSVTSATQDTEPVLAQVGELFLVPPTAVAGWSHLIGAVVLVDSVGSYIPFWPWDHEGVIARDTGHLWVSRRGYTGAAPVPMQSTWFELPPLLQFYLLQWWMTNYGMPGTTSWAFKERSLETFDTVETFVDFVNAALVGAVGKQGYFTNDPSPLSSPFGTLPALVKMNAAGEDFLRCSPTDLGPVPLSGIGDPVGGVVINGFSGYGHQKLRTAIDFRLPVGWPGPTCTTPPAGESGMLGIGVSTLTGVASGDGGFTGLLVMFSSANPPVLLVVAGLTDAGLVAGMYEVLSLPAIADNNWHTLTVEYDFETLAYSAQVDTGDKAFATLTKDQFIFWYALGVMGRRSWVGAPVPNDIPSMDFTNLDLSPDED